MNKIYNITQDMADKLHEGQVFKNFRACRYQAACA